MSAGDRERARLLIEAAEEALDVKDDATIRNYLRLAREQIDVDNTLDEARRRGISTTWTSLGLEKTLPLYVVRKLILEDRLKKGERS